MDKRENDKLLDILCTIFCVIEESIQKSTQLFFEDLF